MKLEAVFIDRDGTIGGNGHFIHPRDFQLFEFTNQSIKLLKEAGLKVFAFTNQNRISRGEATRSEFEEQFKSIGFDAAYICPHAKDSECNCRKPAPGLLLQAAREHMLDLTRCVVIGDVGSTDMIAAAKVGAIKVLVRTGWGEGSLGEYRHTWADVEPEYIADHLLDAVKWVRSLIKNGDNSPVEK